ncbi:TniQ family protein [Rhizobium binae]|uniref:TniQ family protein n=1 Tax=Rhizobium binae TaxID=1138190 RepID=UPI001C82F57D|nr:TniQ family protein [Rhizobium binae]MBX4963674.1 hypothetical protein [Rhizobium binae]
MSRLTELLSFNEGETVASYCSRLAAACGYRHARSFANDLGFRFQDLAVGVDEEVRKFATVLEVSADDLSSGIILSEEQFYVIAGEHFTRSHLHRQRLRFCPLCTRNDEHTRDGRRGHRAFGRADWLIWANRACPIHEVELKTSAHDRSPVFTHDFAANLAAESDEMNAHISSLRTMRPDTLQQYIQARMSGARVSPWLDSFPIYVATTLCDLVGGLERHGLKFTSSQLDQAELSDCASAGFEILHGSESNFREFIRKKSQNFFNGRSYYGGGSLFGRLYEKLAHESIDPSFNPIRKIMLDEVLSVVPLGPGDDFFGPVTHRRLHSLQTAHKNYGVHPKRLLKSLVNAGLVSEDQAQNTPGRILVEADLMKSFVEKSVSCINSSEAMEQLGTSFNTLKLLTANGFFSVVGGKKNMIAEPRYDPHELDAFLKSLRARVTQAANPNLVPMRLAAQVARVSFIELIVLILDAELPSVGWEESKIGLSAIRVDPDELVARVRPRDDLLSLRTIETKMHTSYYVTQALIHEHRIRSATRRNPITGRPQTVVTQDDFAEFCSTYQSLQNIAKDRITTMAKCRKLFVKLGIAPAFTAANMAFYRRSDVPAH